MKGYSLKVEEFEWIWCNGEITHEVSGYSLELEEFEWIWHNGVITYEASGYSLKVEEFEWIWCNGVITRTRTAQLFFAVTALNCYSEKELGCSGPSDYP